MSGTGIAVQGFLQGIYGFLPLAGRCQGHAQVAQGEGRFRMIAQQFLADGHGLTVQGDALFQITTLLVDASQIVQAGGDIHTRLVAALLLEHVPGLEQQRLGPVQIPLHVQAGRKTKHGPGHQRMIFPKGGTQAVHGFAAHGDALFHLSGSKVQAPQVLQSTARGGILHALPLTQQAHGRLDGFDGFVLTALLEDRTPQPVQGQSLMQGIVRPLVQQLTIPALGTGKVTGSLRAREIFDLLVCRAWQTGDPGIVFLDRINRDNPTPAQGEIESTNPCGEQPLLPYEACNLGSINLACFFVPGHAHDEDPAAAGIDWDGLKQVVHLAVRFLDNVIDASRFPLDRIDETVRRNRKIGLGVMGFADLLFQLGIPYDSEAGIALAERIMGFINIEGHAASARLAEERGPFPAYAESVFPQRGEGPYRNATVTTIAPTGTLSIIGGCSSGVEPLFALCFTRNILDGERLVEVNPYFEAALKEAGLGTPELMEQVVEKGSIQSLDALPAAMRKVFVTAMDIDPVWHLRMQAAFQRHTDNAVSKTVNLPHSATEQDIHDIYWLAYKEGCKGVTVYRDGCKSLQVLATGEGQKKMDGEAPAPAEKPRLGVVRKRPEVVQGFTQKIQTGLGAMYLTVNEIDGKPFEVFATIGKSGRSITAKAEAIGRLVSLALRSGVEVRDIVAQIKGIGGEHPVFRGKGLLLSIPDAIAWVLERRYLKDEHLGSGVADIEEHRCPECDEPLVFQEGCLICPACGFSRCG